jgi:hypothetical protein
VANKHRGEIEVTIAGKARILVFDNNTIAELEDIFHKSPIAVLAEMGETMQRDPAAGVIFSPLRSFLWAGLHQRSPGVKLEQVGRLMVREEFADYLAACFDGILAAYGTDKDKLAEKARLVSEAKRKLEDGESLTADETKAAEEADAADPLARSTPKGDATPPSPTGSGSEPSPTV